MTDRSSVTALAERMWLYGLARNRTVDQEPRTVSVTDDEAVVIARALDVYVAGLVKIEPPPSNATVHLCTQEMIDDAMRDDD